MDPDHRVVRPAQASLWAIQFELVAQMDRLPEVRASFANANRQARLGLAALFENLDPVADERKAMAVGAFYQALLGGLADPVAGRPGPRAFRPGPGPGAADDHRGAGRGVTVRVVANRA